MVKQFDLDADSIAKGTAFEEFIRKNIFTDSGYSIVEKTHNFEQNRKDFIESTNKPDYKFRHKKTNREFYVEAKYRTKFDQYKKVHVFKDGQYERYVTYNKPECPVFVAIGYEGSSSNPNSVSIIPINKATHPDIFKTKLEEYKLPSASEPIQDKRLNELFEDAFPTKKYFNNKAVWTSTAVLALFILLLLLNRNSATKGNTGINPELKLKGSIERYYQALENNNVEVLGYFINDKVERWYDKSNMNIESIKKETQAYFEKYPFHEFKIRWESFKFNELPNGDYNVSYNLDYRIKSSTRSTYKPFNLNTNYCLI